MTKKDIEYKEAISELEEIVKRLESNENIDINELSNDAKRASELIKYCKKELTIINKNIEKAINEIETEE